MKRPWAMTAPAAFLLALPILQIASSRFAVSFLNFGQGGLRAHLIYGGVAPVIGWMLWRMHPRARFAFYVFASCELIRFGRDGFHHWEVPLLYGGLIAWLYTPLARDTLPIIRAIDRINVYASLWQRRKRS
jgi:hypothetical protein